MADARAVADTDTKRRVPKQTPTHHARDSSPLGATSYNIQSGDPSTTTWMPDLGRPQRRNPGPWQAGDAVEAGLRLAPECPSAARNGPMPWPGEGDAPETPSTTAHSTTAPDLLLVPRKRPRDVYDLPVEDCTESPPERGVSSVTKLRRAVTAPPTAVSAGRRRTPKPRQVARSPVEIQGLSEPPSSATTRLLRRLSDNVKLSTPIASVPSASTPHAAPHTSPDSAAPGRGSALLGTRTSSRQLDSGPMAQSRRLNIEIIIRAEPLKSTLSSKKDDLAGDSAEPSKETPSRRTAPEQPAEAIQPSSKRVRFSSPVEPLPYPTVARRHEKDRPGTDTADEQRPPAPRAELRTVPDRDPDDDVDDSNTIAYWRHFAKMKRRVAAREERERAEMEARIRERRERKAEKQMRRMERLEKEARKEREAEGQMRRTEQLEKTARKEARRRERDGGTSEAVVGWSASAASPSPPKPGAHVGGLRPEDKKAASPYRAATQHEQEHITEATGWWRDDGREADRKRRRKGHRREMDPRGC